MSKLVPKICIAAILIFLYLPIIVVIIFAFNKTKSRTVFNGPTLNWFFELFKDHSIMTALLNSFVLAILASIIATIIGTIAALQIVKMRKRNQSIVMSLNYIPIINSDIVMGISLMLLMIFILNIR